jgi:hypothetical protein
VTYPGLADSHSLDLPAGAQAVTAPILFYDAKGDILNAKPYTYSSARKRSFIRIYEPEPQRRRRARPSAAVVSRSSSSRLSGTTPLTPSTTYPWSLRHIGAKSPGSR